MTFVNLCIDFCTIIKTFIELSSLFDNFEEMSKDSFNSYFKIDLSGLSQYISEQIKAKTSIVDEYALKEMVVHSIQDITKSTYTVRDVG